MEKCVNGFKEIFRLSESYGPAACGLAAFFVLILFRQQLTALLIADKISIANLFSAIFGWASIQTGCVFAIYGFVAGRTDGFIGEARNTRSMRRYGSFLKRAMFSGFILTIGSMPLLALKFRIEEHDARTFIAIAAWIGIFVWAFFSFARAAYIFGIIVRAENRSES